MGEAALRYPEDEPAWPEPGRVFEDRGGKLYRVLLVAKDAFSKQPYVISHELGTEIRWSHRLTFWHETIEGTDGRKRQRFIPARKRGRAYPPSDNDNL